MQKNNIFTGTSFNSTMPVLFLIFNRMETTKLVFQEIRNAKPPRLYLASDGSRPDEKGERDKVLEIRNYIKKNIDWDCELHTLFNDSNLGCKKSVSNAINWFFNQEEMGIVLEDDCLPNNSFFRYCEELLLKYKYDQRIFLITGYNKQNIWKPEQNDYFFSNLGGIWGWASWSRAWKHYDVDVTDIESFISQDGFRNSLGSSLGDLKQNMIFNGLKVNNVDSWAMQWGYARHKNNALTCIPSKSLIRNIGFGEKATHTFGDNLDGVECHEISFPLKDNKFVVSDESYDELLFKQPNFQSRIKNKIKKIFKTN